MKFFERLQVISACSAHLWLLDGAERELMAERLPKDHPKGLAVLRSLNEQVRQISEAIWKLFISIYSHL